MHAKPAPARKSVRRSRVARRIAASGIWFPPGCFFCACSIVVQRGGSETADPPISLQNASPVERGILVATFAAAKGLGSVDSKDSLLGANQIQGCFWGGNLGCNGSTGFERRCLGADGAPDYRPA